MKKILNKVTVTGADDSTKIEDLVKIQEEFPFVEFGILLSRKSMGNSRFPSKEWLINLAENWVDKGLHLSGHICGEWVKEILLGKWPSKEFMALKNLDHFSLFNRFQLNTHGIKHKYDLAEFNKLIMGSAVYGRQPIIFQLDNANDEFLAGVKEFMKHQVSGTSKYVHGLFDLSHGNGVLPDKWPGAVETIYCGYAGGLSLENVAIQLEKIEKVVGDNLVWIDAETHLRSDNDKKFDLEKVRKFLKVAQPWVKND